MSVVLGKQQLLLKVLIGQLNPAAKVEIVEMHCLDKDVQAFGHIRGNPSAQHTEKGQTLTGWIFVLLPM